MKCELIIRMYSPCFKSQNDGFLKNVIIVPEGVEVAGHFVMLFCVISSDSLSSNDVDLAWEE